MLEVGTLDWLARVNHRVRDALIGYGVDVSYPERSVGHNWGGWRDGLVDAFAGCAFMTPRPLPALRRFELGGRAQ